MKRWLYHFFWFIKESASFLSCSYLSVILRGGILKAIKFASDMVEYDKLTSEQKLEWYLRENKVMNF